MGAARLICTAPSNLITQQRADIVIPEAVAVVLSGRPACSGGILVNAEPLDVDRCTTVDVSETRVYALPVQRLIAGVCL